VTYKSLSPADTEKLGFEFGQNAKSGDIFCLSGELGAGKTVFAQGLARGLGYPGRVTSPTFTLMNIYESGRLPFYHFDLYRMENGLTDLESTGCEDFLYAGGVSLVEWPERAEGFFGNDVTWVEIRATADAAADHREISINRANGYTAETGEI